MIVPNSSACERAKPFYYDLLYAESTEPAPIEVLDHIRTCDHCHMQMNYLKETLSREEMDDDSKEMMSNRKTNLTLQFSFTEREVTCVLVKPFLAMLNLDDLKTNIPTPITAHLDHCPACLKDFKTIQTLTLNQSQLRRLSQLFSDTILLDFSFCAIAQDQIPRLAVMDPKDCSPELLDHICQCRVCRGLFYKTCWGKSGSHPESSCQSDIECKQIETSEIFNVAVPYGLRVEDAHKMFLPDSAASHIQNCQCCKKKVQDLHQIIYSIIDRKESDVITRFQISDPKKEETNNTRSRELYRDFPVEVSVAESCETSKEMTATMERNNTFGKAKQKEKRKSFAWLLQKRIALPAAAAAVVLMALSLIFNTSSATAISRDQIHTALVKIDAIHISKWRPDRTEPIQEAWISRSANLYINKTGNIVVHWDFANKGTRKMDLSTRTIEFEAATPKSLENTQLFMKSALGIIPPSGLSDISKFISWKRITVETKKTGLVATEVYDLEWKENDFAGSEVFRRWRGYIDPATHLPLQVEWYIKTLQDKEYELERICTIEYLNNVEIQETINQYLQ